MQGAKKRDVYGFRDLQGPIGRSVRIPEPVKGMHGAWREDEIRIFTIQHSWSMQTEKLFMNIIAELKENYAEAAALWEAYDKRLQEFRSNVKNDITSLEATARRTTEAVVRMNKSYGDVITQLNGPEMLAAIANAERLAAAMQALANLQSHKLTFAVIDAQGSRT